MKSSVRIDIAILVVAIIAVAKAPVFSMQKGTSSVKPQLSTNQTLNTTPTLTPTRATPTPTTTLSTRSNDKKG